MTITSVYYFLQTACHDVSADLLAESRRDDKTRAPKQFSVIIKMAF